MTLPLDFETRLAAAIDGKTKPIGALGRLEGLAADLARLRGFFFHVHKALVAAAPDKHDRRSRRPDGRPVRPGSPEARAGGGRRRLRPAAPRQPGARSAGHG